MIKVSELQNVKHVANAIDIEIVSIANEMLWHSGEPQQELISDLMDLLYDLAIKQFTPEEIKYLEMRKRNDSTDMRG